MYDPSSHAPVGCLTAYHSGLAQLESPDLASGTVAVRWWDEPDQPREIVRVRIYPEWRNPQRWGECVADQCVPGRWLRVNVYFDQAGDKWLTGYDTKTAEILASREPLYRGAYDLQREILADYHLAAARAGQPADRTGRDLAAVGGIVEKLARLAVTRSPEVRADCWRDIAGWATLAAQHELAP